MRLEDWPERLAAFVESRRSTPFEWGSNDCVTFAADCVNAITEVDHLGSLRGQWGTAQEAHKALLPYGGLLKAAESVLIEPVPVLMAQRGDVVLFDSSGRDTLGICLGVHVVAPGETGLVFSPVSLASMAWRI
jgi:hypothetical protein